MATVTWRWDYAKFILETPAGTFNQYYDTLRRYAGSRKWGKGDWDRDHKVQAFYSQSPDWERTSIEIWGECAGVVGLLPYAQWSQWAKRLDIRAIQWDVGEDALLHTGQRLQRTVSSRTIEVFSSRKASKRLGRDRGGKGFRVGSRKSDVCIVAYKRAQEPAAVEYRFTGQALLNCLHYIDDNYYTTSTVLDTWPLLMDLMRERADKRFNAVFREAGIGEYYPIWAEYQDSDYDALQSSFVLAAKATDAEEHDEQHWNDGSALAQSEQWINPPSDT